MPRPISGRPTAPGSVALGQLVVVRGNERLRPGASPQEVERELVQPLEEQLRTVEGLVKLSSESGNSTGTIEMEFPVGTVMSEAGWKAGLRPRRGEREARDEEARRRGSPVRRPQHRGADHAGAGGERARGDAAAAKLLPYRDVDPGTPEAAAIDAPILGDFFFVFFVARGRSVFIGLLVLVPILLALCFRAFPVR